MDLAAWCLILEPTRDAGAAAAEVEYPREIVKGPTDTGESCLDVEERLLPTFIKKGPVFLRLVASKPLTIRSMRKSGGRGGSAG
jgi:hypothetical protein